MIVASTLRNGLRVLIEPVRGVRTACAGIWFAAGSRHDPPGLEGTAHLLEHVVFKGSARRDARALAEAMDALGGQFNAFTTREHTCFHGRTLASRCAEGLQLLAELVVAPRCDAGDVERERRVVLDELAMIADDPGETADEAFARALWDGHPLGRPQAGTPTSVRRLTAEVLMDFHARHYVARRAVLAIAGQVDPDRALAWADRTLGCLPPGEPPEPAAPPRPAARALRLARASEQAHLVLGTAAPAATEEARWEAALLASILGGSPSSRLFQAVREDRGLCYDVGAAYGEYADAGELVAFLASSPAQVGEAAAVALAELRRLAREGVPAAELARHRDQLVASVWLAQESMEARMTRLGRQAVAGMQPLSASEVVARVRRITTRSLRELAERLGDPAQWAAAFVGPRRAAPGPWAWVDEAPGVEGARAGRARRG